MKKYIILLFAALTCCNAYTQSDTSSQQSVDSVLQSDYDRAYFNYETKYYKEALRIIEPYYLKGDASAEVYQLVGNIYDEMGNQSRAFSVYNEGLMKYPDAGCLFLELGNLKYKTGDYPQALYRYEKGIEHDPMFASNYYRAAKVFFLSTETVWGVMYGELFMLLEQNSDRCREMSADLFEAYFNSFSLNKGKTVADFNNDIIVYSDSFERPNKFPEVFNTNMTKAAFGKKFIDIAALISIRNTFMGLIYQKNPDFDNPLFAYWKKITKAGHWQAYNYWLFAYGNNNESATWINQNKDKWNSFLTWMKKNPISLNKSEYFSRYLME
ncbi:MAG: tetratricopeptide repeat protein [Bacteroidales bacterium]|nr:tetratricopeptide repeat protein [Bacteroidales bacterium]